MLLKPEKVRIFKEPNEDTEPLVDDAADESPINDQLGDILGDESAEDESESDDEPASDDPAFADASAESTAVIDDDRQFWKEAELLAKIAEASREREDALSVVLVRKEYLKEAKETLAAIESRLFRHTAELGRKLDPQQAGESQPASEAEATDGAEDNSWRDLPTVELLTGLSGIGKKKIEILSQAAPTVGDLEDLRGKASEQHKSFAELLPKGFGQKAVDAIENALIDHIANFAASQSPAEPEVYQHFPWVGAKVEELRKTFHEYEAPTEEDSDYEWYSDGFDSFDSGAPVTECPVRVESEDDDSRVSENNQINWLCGWLDGERKRAK